MASAPGGRGRRKQARPQRKPVEMERSETLVTGVLTSVGPAQGARAPNGWRRTVMQVVQGGGLPPDLVSAKAAVAEHQDEERKIQEYLRRSDTAVIFPEPVGQPAAVPSLSNGITKDSEESGGGDHFIKCPQCQKGCSSFQSLKEHLEATHPNTTADEGGGAPSTLIASPPPPPTPTGPTTAGPHTCSQCAASFNTKEQLEKHELLHSPNAQVSCKVCHKTFANVYRLQRHMISHDESAILRKFKCTECEKAFKFKHHLKEHIRIHSGEKPFECANCGKRFSHSGSYSSHMTSKKCLVMNLKMGRSRGTTSTHPLLDKSQAGTTPGSVRLSKRGSGVVATTAVTAATAAAAAAAAAAASLNNNITPNSNQSYLPILPKYPEAAAAAFLSVMAPRDAYAPQPTNTATALHPFYMSSAALHMSASAHPIGPYPMPTSLGQLLEQLQSGTQTQRSHHSEHVDNDTTTQSGVPVGVPVPVSSVPISSVPVPVSVSLPLPLPLSVSVSVNNSSSDIDDIDTNKINNNLNRDKRMDIDDIDRDSDKVGVPSPESSSGDLEAINRILETVNATVTRQQLHANMQKLSTDSASSECRSISSPLSSDEPRATGQLNIEINDIDNSLEMKSEGLAAKLEEAVHVKQEEPELEAEHEHEHEHDHEHEPEPDDEQLNININDCKQINNDKCDEFDVDSEGVTTTDHVSEDGRKVRVRSLIADEQLTVLKDHYAINPRPKREELARIAERIGFPVRVVQVWFQNTRARDRREGRLVQIPYSPVGTTSTTIGVCYPPSLVPSGSPHIGARTLPYGPTSPHYNNINQVSEQPLDLSTKKGPLSASSSPSSSPRRPASVVAHSDSGEEAVNLSHKSSRSPTPFHQLPYQPTHYQSSNCSSDYHRSPSPSPVHPPTSDAYANGSRLARILAQPAHRLAMASVSSMGLLPMERLLHYNTDLKSPLLNTASSSPNSERRSWKLEDADDSGVSQELYTLDDDLQSPSKRAKLSQLALKGLGVAPLLSTSTPEPEVEGQFICDQCDKAFSKQSSLARHKYEHSGQRPHKCDECPKAFKHKHHLTEHKRLHSGEKPFQCSKCLKRFSHSGSYSQHMNHRYSYCKPYRE